MTKKPEIVSLNKDSQGIPYVERVDPQASDAEVLATLATLGFAVDSIERRQFDHETQGDFTKGRVLAVFENPNSTDPDKFPKKVTFWSND